MKIDVSSIRAILISAEGLQCHEDVTDCDAWTNCCAIQQDPTTMCPSAVLLISKLNGKFSNKFLQTKFTGRLQPKQTGKITA
jgi:hypothetical protein